MTKFDMMRFEQQVAEALVVALTRDQAHKYDPETYAELVAGRRRPPIVDELAPRVAAAIDAAIMDHDRPAFGAHDVALKALRGET